MGDKSLYVLETMRQEVTKPALVQHVSADRCDKTDKIEKIDGCNHITSIPGANKPSKIDKKHVEVKHSSTERHTSNIDGRMVQNAMNLTKFVGKLDSPDVAADVSGKDH